jgi:hypothetical protein
MFQQPGQIQNQQLLSSQPGIILPPAPYSQPQQQLLQQLPSGQFIQRQLSVGGGGNGIQNFLTSQQSFLSPSNSTGLLNPCPPGTQFIS